MDFPGAMTAIVTQVTAAAATLVPPITDVAHADPVPRGRCIRIWYGGEDLPPAMYAQNSMAGEMTGEVVHITAYWPVGDSGEVLASNRDADSYTLKDQIRTRINAHSTLGGKVTDLELRHFTTIFEDIGGASWRILDAELLLSFNDYPTAP